MRPVDIDIKSRRDILQSLHLSQADFDGALETALEDLAGKPKNQLPAPQKIRLVVHGEEYFLGDLANIDVTLGSSQAANSFELRRSVTVTR